MNIRWKAFDEIYKIYMLLHRSGLNVSANFVEFVGVFFIKTNAKNFDFFQNFVMIFADFHELCSDFLRFSRTCGKTLQLLEISRFQFNVFQFNVFQFNNFHIGTAALRLRRRKLLRSAGLLLLVAAVVPLAVAGRGAGPGAGRGPRRSSSGLAAGLLDQGVK